MWTAQIAGGDTSNSSYSVDCQEAAAPTHSLNQGTKIIQSCTIEHQVHNVAMKECWGDQPP